MENADFVCVSPRVRSCRRRRADNKRRRLLHIPGTHFPGSVLSPGQASLDFSHGSETHGTEDCCDWPTDPVPPEVWQRPGEPEWSLCADYSRLVFVLFCRSRALRSLHTTGSPGVLLTMVL